MSEQYLAILKAVYDYDPQSDDEVRIKEDQILFLLERTDEDWWKVKPKPDDGQEADSPTGLVPAAYVEQAPHQSVVKALYDYDAAAPGELSIKEDDVLLAFSTDDEWLLVQSESNGKAGYVPASYVEENSASSTPPASAPTSGLVIPDSPPKPSAPYVDPAERVAASKAQADDIKTWSVTHIDSKNKKKKGTLGVGNGAVFFASESDKTPVQKWQTADISNTSIEKNKHVHITITGSNPSDLHFTVSSKDTAEAIVAKLDSSRSMSQSEPQEEEEEEQQQQQPEPAPTPKPKASVHFSPASPVIIPPRAAPGTDEEEEEEEPPRVNGSASHHRADDGEDGIALYDFTADGDDELTVAEGDKLLIIEKDGDEWWKCRDSRGREGVVPASYLELTAPSFNHTPISNRQQEVEPEEEEEEDDGAAEREAAAARAAEEAARQQREAEEKLAKEKEKEKAREKEMAREKAEQAERERRKREAQKQAEAAEAARAKRKEEARRRAETASPPTRPASSPPEPDRSSRDKGGSKGSSNNRSSTDASRPPPERVRTWHDRSGQYHVEAAFIGFSNGKLRLHKVNGVIVEVPSEKMSLDDMRYVEKLAQREREREHKPRVNSDDDVPLAVRRRSMVEHHKKKAPQVDWFDFFLSAGCDVDDCTRYAAAFERDKIDVSILGDINDSTMRSLGLREGDIIRVNKHIKEKFPKKDPREEQIEEDEKLARALQQKETQAAPNLFASGPDGALKAPRRGRPTPSSSTPPASVDLISLSAASDQMPRTNSPVASTKAASPVQSPQRSGSALAVKSGFDDDAWTNRPSSAKPANATPPPAQAARTPSAPPAAAPPPASATTAPPQPASAAPSTSSQTSGTSSLAKTTESDIFDQLARLSELRKTQSPPAVTPPAVSPPAQVPPQAPPIFATPSPGMGAGQPAIPMGQITVSPPPQPQYNGPRGPFAPVPANETLLRPLVSTHTGFSGFVPTRPTSTGANNVSPFAGGVPAPPVSQQPSFLNTGFPGGSLMSQPTGIFQGSLMSQPTGIPPMGGFSGSNFVQSNPTGFNVGFGQPAMNFAQPPPPVPPLPPSPPVNNTNPANIFAQMKSGTFATENSTEPQPADRYSALRPNGLFSQPTGFPGGYR